MLFWASGHLLMPLMELHSLIIECKLAVTTAPFSRLAHVTQVTNQLSMGNFNDCHFIT